MARQRMRNKTDCVDRFLLKDHTNYGYTGSRSIYFEDDVLYSYGEHWPLCIEHNQLVTIDEQGEPTWEKMYFVNANNYSSSTAQQKWCVIRRLEALNKRYVLIHNPKDNYLMINLHKWIKYKQSVAMNHPDEPVSFAVIKNSLEQHLLEQLIKSIRAKKNKINEKQLIANTNRVIKHIENIDLDWQHKQLTYQGNKVLFMDNIKQLAYMGSDNNLDKQAVIKDLAKKFLVSIRTQSSDSVHMINLKYYRQVIQKYQLDMKDIEQELLIDKLSTA